MRIKNAWNRLNLVGKNFGRLTVIANAGTSNNRKSIWICQCECGATTKPITSRKLVSGHTKSCGCIRKENIKIANYQKQIVTDGKSFHCYMCKEIKPIEEKAPNGKDRRSNGRCRSCERQRRYCSARTLHRRYKHLQQSSKRRYLPLTIAEYQFTEIIKHDKCHYCDDMLDPTGSGLDRKDNDKKIGYTLDNVVPCCGECNRMRGNSYSYEEMLLLSPALKEIHKKRKQPGGQ